MGDTETTVGKWLAVNGAEKYTKAFFDKGYKELLDIPRDAIAALVSDGALAKKLADSFDQWTDPGPPSYRLVWESRIRASRQASGARGSGPVATDGEGARRAGVHHPVGDEGQR
jgi:hypothetical protein